MQKGTYFVTRDKKFYQVAGQWDGLIVLMPVEDKDDQVLVYTPVEMNELIRGRVFNKLYPVKKKEKDKKDNNE